MTETAEIKDERRPLIRDPVWHYNHRYSRGSGCDSEAVDEVLRLETARNQRFQWMLFLAVTVLSIVILLATMGILIKLSETHPPLPSKSATKHLPLSKLPTSLGLSATASISPTLPPIPLPYVYVFINGSSPGVNN